MGLGNSLQTVQGGSNPYAPWDFSDDFTDSQGILDARWTTAGTQTAPQAGTDNFKWSGNRETTNHAMSASPTGGVVSDTAWLYRVRMNATESVPGTYSSYTVWGMSASDASVGATTAQDMILTNFRTRPANKFIHTGSTDGVAASSIETLRFATAYANGSDVFIEQIRTTATQQTSAIYTSSTYATLTEMETQSTVASTTQNLRYLKFMNMNAASAGADEFTGVGGDVFFIDGVTEAPV